MEITSLPDQFDLIGTGTFQLFDYQTSTNCLKSRINLTKNTFSFLQEGTKGVFTGHQSISIQNTDFILLKSGHCLMTENLSSGNGQYRSILFFFPDRVIFEFLRKYDLLNAEKMPAKSVQVFAYDTFIRTFVKSLIDISKMSMKMRQKLLQVKFYELLLYMVEVHGPNFLRALSADTDLASSHFVRIVEANRLNRLTLKELAFLSSMSVSTFKRKFERHYGASPIKWFQEQRLDHSAYLLSEQAKRPSDIYEEIGYENLSNFIQAFKTKFGITPKQFQMK